MMYNHIKNWKNHNCLLWYKGYENSRPVSFCIQILLEEEFYGIYYEIFLFRKQ